MYLLCEENVIYDRMICGGHVQVIAHAHTFHGKNDTSDNTVRIYEVRVTVIAYVNSSTLRGTPGYKYHKIWGCFTF